MPKRLLKFPRYVADGYITHFREQPGYLIVNTLAALSVALMFGWQIRQNHQLHTRANEAKRLAATTQQLTKQNSSLILKIQNNRRDVIYLGCRDQNKRHRETVDTLQKLFDKSPGDMQQKQAAFTQTKLLIDALAPHRDCVKLANKVVKPKIKKKDK